MYEPTPTPDPRHRHLSSRNPQLPRTPRRAWPLPGIAMLAMLGLTLGACAPDAEEPTIEEPAVADGQAEQPHESKPVALDTSYPLDWCPVSKETLGSMGEPVKIDHEGREIMLCCEGCREEFEANAEDLLTEVDAAIIEKKKDDYPLDVCVVAGAELGSMGEPLDLVHNNRLVRFCCAGCDDQFYEDPEGHFAAIAAGETYDVEVHGTAGHQAGNDGHAQH